MIAPDRDYNTFISPQEKLRKYKRWGLSSPKAKGIRRLSYHGLFCGDAPSECDVLGYISDHVIIIGVNDELHCINPDYLIEMQTGRAEFVEIIQDEEGYDEQPPALGVTLKNASLSTKAQLSRFKNYVVLDVETTGYSWEEDEIIEIGCLKVVGGEIVDTFSTLVNPRRLISPSITRLTGISNEMVKDAPVMAEIIAELHAFIGNLPVVAHNAAFDGGFLRRAYEVHSIPAAPIVMADTLRLSRRAFPDLPNHKLETIIRFFALSDSQTHRALDDARHTHTHLLSCIDALMKKD